MKKHEKKTVNVNPLSNQELIDSYDYLATAASSHYCTGWIFSAPLNFVEMECDDLKILCKIPVFS